MKVGDPEVDIWLNGPSVLKKKEEVWKTVERFEVEENDPEIKKTVNVNLTSVEESLIDRLESRISNWFRCIRVVAIMRKFIRLCKEKMRLRRRERVWRLQLCKEKVLMRRSEEKVKGELTVVDLKEAEEWLIRMVQERYFRKELDLLKTFDKEGGREGDKRRKAALKKSSSVRKLDPFLDKAGIMRVGGRLRKSCLDESVKHPVILPRKGKLTLTPRSAWGI